MNTPPPNRKPVRQKRRSGKAQRAFLLDVASEMLAKGGPDALSVRKVADAAGISTMGIYTAFGSKEGLLTALYEEAFERIATYQEAVPKGSDPLEWLSGLGQAYRRFAQDNPAYYALMIASTMPLTDLTKKSGAAQEIAEQRAYRCLEEAVAACQEAGYFDKNLSTEDITSVMWATVHGHASLEIAGFHKTREEADRHYDLFAGAVVKGLLTPDGLQKWLDRVADRP